MMVNDIEGNWHDGATSGVAPAVFHCSGAGYVSVRVDGVSVAGGEWSQLVVPDRLGNIPRQIRFPSGGTFSTGNNDAIDALQRQYGARGFGQSLYRLESRWRIALGSLALMLAFIGWCVVWGAPLAARGIAGILPQQVSEYADKQALEFFDEHILEPSQLPPERIDSLRAQFYSMLGEGDNDINLLFRRGGGLGANAFALPAGTLVFTDEIVRLAKDDAELLAVFFHELGHVRHRHGMRLALQGSIIAVSIALFTGDMNAVAELFLGVPLLLLHNSYSRAFESEADRYALEQLDARGVSAQHFADMLRRLEHSHRPPDETVGAEGSDKKDDNGSAIEGYLSTHPLTDERIRAIREYPGSN